MSKLPIDEDKALMLPLEDYLMIRYVAAQEGTTAARLVNSWLLGYLDAKNKKENDRWK